MNETSRGMVTRVLQAMDSGDSAAAEKLLPIVYEELRSLGRALMSKVPPGNTLQGTTVSVATTGSAACTAVSGSDIP